MESELNPLSEAQRAEQIGAYRYKRTDERQTDRNGSCLRPRSSSMRCI
ncbi:MAG: transposase [Paenibacillaceae bacterium]|nr:transposase [Paenibacillaceae bacterium]